MSEIPGDGDPDKNETSTKSHIDKCFDHWDRKFRHRPTIHWVANSIQAGILIAAAVYGGLTYKLWDTSRQQLEMQQRAKIFAGLLQISAEPTDPAPVINIRIPLRNIGETEGTDVVVSYAADFLPTEPPIDWQAPSIARTRPTTLFPNKGDDHVPSVQSGPIDVGERIEAYRAHRLSLYIRVLITYRDLFHKPHWSELCMFHVYAADQATFSICPVFGIKTDAESSETNRQGRDTARGSNQPTGVRTATKPGAPDPEQGYAASNQQDSKDLWQVFLERLVDPVTWFTFMLVGVGLLQWRTYHRQANLMNAGLTETQKAADAAKSSADVGKRTLALANRPWFEIVGWEVQRWPRQAKAGQPRPECTNTIAIRFTLKNTSNSPTRITAIKVSAFGESITPDIKPHLLTAHGEWQPVAVGFHATDAQLNEHTIGNGQFTPVTATVEIAYRDVVGSPPFTSRMLKNDGP